MEENKYKILEGSMLDILPTLEENSFDSCITDPPYELNFMGKGWDRSGIAFRKETWEQVYRVLKPGAYLCAFGGSRTFHRIACAIEDAGFEIRDTIMWLYGSGFPKSHNVGLDIDKRFGCENRGHRIATANRYHPDGTLEPNGENLPPYEGKTEEGKKWSGYGTCLKPAYEPIIIARKPIEKSVAENVLKYGCGAINIDECRVGNEIIKGGTIPRIELKDHEGRFPSNVILTYDETDFDEVCGGMPYTKSTGGSGEASTTKCFNNVRCGSTINTGANLGGLGDEGSASRYFYCAKASKKDRDEGLDMFEEKQTTDGCIRANSETARKFGANSALRKNIHPTVKPIDLMQYLVRMFTPKGGAILEPFAGSGSTGKATMFENRERNANYTITMIEITHEYIPIIKARCDYAINKYKYDDEKALRERKEKGELNIFDFDYGE